MALSAAQRSHLLEVEGGLRDWPFPPQLIVENTSYCNLQCVRCWHKEMHRPQRHMARALWDKVVEEVGSEMPGCELWPTFHGEALVMGKDGELWDRLDHAARAACENLVLNSNGTLLTRWDNIDRVLASPLKRFILSLDGFARETFEAIRVGADRDGVFAAVEELLRRRVRLGQVYPVIICQYSIMEQNAGEVEAFTDHWRSRGAEIKNPSHDGVGGKRKRPGLESRSRHGLPDRVSVGEQHDGDTPER